ncbi:serine/threonine protein kinase [Nocardia tenerifensis]|uniref:non-specific serine/threonine protein kinase n=1 Tax=Nocardia tenerifensis TaxID=228006 RepID=A0A318KJ56_9NOCA|nr:serine/threonine-protein kinase [Nocardia tenerifensis]PXX60997.1 serine/threonine protein kinase [Nocardia tenerifensis]
MLLRPGQIFAGYSIVRLLGSGGMGAVYLAEDPALPRQVALKVLAEHLGANQRYRSIFRREAELVCRLDHPNVVSVYNRGEEGDTLWMAMQYVDGTDASELMRKEPSGLAPDRAARIVCAAAKGLQHAHEQNLLHRDVKPSNILVAAGDDGERVLVADFGLARAIEEAATVTETGWRACTPAFAAPEVLAGRPVDRCADIYSLGATLSALLTGSNPSGPSPPGGTRTVRDTPEPTRVRPDVPPALDDVIAQAMAADPRRRYQSCTEFADAVRSAIGDTERSPRQRGLSGLVRGRRARIAVLGGIVAVAAATAVWPTPHRSDGAAPTSVPQTSGARTGLLRCFWSARVPIGTGFYVELPSAAADHDDPRCALNEGDRGDSVTVLRQALTMCHGIELDKTTVYDLPMKRAIRHLQVDHSADVDGIYGPQTRAKAIQWPVFRVADGAFDGRCVPAP